MTCVAIVYVSPSLSPCFFIVKWCGSLIPEQDLLISDTMILYFMEEDFHCLRIKKSWCKGELYSGQYNVHFYGIYFAILPYEIWVILNFLIWHYLWAFTLTSKWGLLYLCKYKFPPSSTKSDELLVLKDSVQKNHQESLLDSLTESGWVRHVCSAFLLGFVFPSVTVLITPGHNHLFTSMLPY